MQAAKVLPPKSDTVTGELAGVVTGAHVEMAVIASWIVKAVRVDNAAGQRRKVVVQRLDDFLRIGVARSEEIAEQFLFLGVDAQNRVA